MPNPDHTHHHDQHDHEPVQAHQMVADMVAVRLKRSGHRVTQPRLWVWQALADADRHVTADELATLLTAAGTPVNAASIYRTLGLFRTLGLARESRLGTDDTSYWELSHPDEHVHLVCDHCGEVTHHVGSLVQNITEHLNTHHGFEPSSVEVVVRGTCPACRAGTAAVIATDSQ